MVHAFLENCQIKFKSKPNNIHFASVDEAREIIKKKKCDKTQKNLKTKSFNANMPA